MKYSIVYIFIAACAIFTACSSSSYLAADDVYYWADKAEVSANSKQSPSASSDNTSANTIEYVSVQDTVVTIRVKR